MVTEDLPLAVAGETLAATRILAAPDRPPAVVSFHGIGAAAGRHNILYVLGHLGGRGVSSACFDFAGHGGSSGSVAATTLRMRIAQAEEAARMLCGAAPAAILGTSMGAYLAAVLAPRLRPRALVLFAPAAYPDDALDAPLEPPPAPGVSSAVRDALRDFRGRAVVVVGRHDEAVPPDVLAQYTAIGGAEVIRLESPHRVHPWLREHEDDRAAVLAAIERAVC